MFKKQTNFKILFISIEKQARINESKQWQGSLKFQSKIIEDQNTIFLDY
jgi:hypothetical protein